MAHNFMQIANHMFQNIWCTAILQIRLFFVVFFQQKNVGIFLILSENTVVVLVRIAPLRCF